MSGEWEEDKGGMQGTNKGFCSSVWTKVSTKWAASPQVPGHAFWTLLLLKPMLRFTDGVFLPVCCEAGQAGCVRQPGLQSGPFSGKGVSVVWLPVPDPQRAPGEACP